MKEYFQHSNDFANVFVNLSMSWQKTIHSTGNLQLLSMHSVGSMASSSVFYLEWDDLFFQVADAISAMERDE